MGAVANRLIEETRPYLLQHAYNPVDWHSWGAEALRRAKEEDKLILLSIGYSACHWSGSGLEFDDRGPHRLKGVPDEWRLFAVAGGI